MSNAVSITESTIHYDNVEIDEATSRQKNGESIELPAVTENARALGMRKLVSPSIITRKKGERKERSFHDRFDDSFEAFFLFTEFSLGADVLLY